MEDPVFNVPTMVSRLPKFGSRPPGGSGPLPNGSHLPVISGIVGKGLPSARQNGAVRMPPSLKWKGKGVPTERGMDTDRPVDEGGTGPPSRQQPQSPVVVREIKKPFTATVKVRGCASALSSTSPRTIPHSSSRTGPRGPLPKQTQSGPSLCNGKQGLTLNGQASRRFGSGGSLRRALMPGSPHSNLPSSRSQSSDSLKSSPSLSEESMVRSQSLTHVRRLPSPTEPPITRSYSFNKASELAKELPRPLAKAPLAKSPLTRLTPVLSGGRGSGLVQPSKGFTAPVKHGSGTSSLVPPTTLRKSLLPSTVSSKPSSALSYRLSRPSLIKQPRPVLAGKAQSDLEVIEGRRNSVETPPVTPDQSSATESPGSTPEEPSKGLPKEPADPSVVRPLGEGLEDMSLSSTSSLERNDNSEEYMDDFDNLGNGGDGILLLSAHDAGLDQLQPDADDDNAVVNRHHGGSTVTELHSFLSESVDWAGMGLTGRGDYRPSSRRASHALLGGADYAHGSSLDLSPSDSSGGTYMWDEEGLEPLGTTTHPCGSYDSDLNSMDILNNLDNLESCDLDDDDLMLDDDLPEEGSLHSDADGMSHLAHWRRQLCWGTQDHLHNDNMDGVFQPYDGLQGQGSGSTGLEQAVELDELTLRHMAEDCSSVKAQLQQLKMLLQLEDGDELEEDTLTLETLSPVSREDPVQARQVEELLKEVQELREELRSKDRTILQLSQQLAVPVEPTRCHCQRAPAPEAVIERVTFHDKATQTPWRVPAAAAPQILQPSRPWPSAQCPQGRLTSSAHTGVPSEPSSSSSSSSDPGWGDSPPKAQLSSLPCPCPSPGLDAPAVAAAPVPATVSAPPAGCLDPGPDELSFLLSTQLKITDSEGPGVRVSPRLPGPRLRPDPAHRSLVPPERVTPCIPQSPNSLKKASIPKRPQEDATTSITGFPRKERGAHGMVSPRPGPGPAAPLSRLRQLPPPSRGLPCFSYGPQTSAPAVGTSTTTTTASLPVPPDLRPRALRQTQGPRDPESTGLKARGLVPPSHSRLPKPKSH